MEGASSSLTLQQELFWVSFCQNVDKLSDVDTKALAKNIYKQMLIQEARYKQILAYQWGITDGTLSLEEKISDETGRT